MAATFKIYCDEIEPDQKGVIVNEPKREPLGLRQAPPRPKIKEFENLGDEEQENDISLASLGSEYVPSILYDDELDSDEPEDDDCDMSELNAELAKEDRAQMLKSKAYLEDIKRYMHDLEKDEEFRPLPNYMEYQTDIDSNKRTILLNWLYEIHEEFGLQDETLFICANIIDRFLSKMSVTTSKLQLLGVAAMFMASKYEEIYPPALGQFVDITDDTYSGEEIIQMEQEIIKSLNFRISAPTISFFLREILCRNEYPDGVRQMAQHLCYLSLLTEKFLIYYPSEIALSAVILATRRMKLDTPLTNEFVRSNAAQIERGLPLCIEQLMLLPTNK